MMILVCESDVINMLVDTLQQSQHDSVSHVLHVGVKCRKMDPGLILPAWQDWRGHLAAAQFGRVDQYLAR